MGKCALIPDGNSISVVTPYNPEFVYELKRYIPASDRQWDGDKKRWLVTAQYAQKMQDIIMSVYNEMVLLPTIKAVKPVTKSQIIDVRYIGTTKDRGNDERSAFGWTNNGWNVIFPENVLTHWFDAPQNPGEQPTLYSVLNVKRTSTDDEIKSGYRRMALQWHPDKCHEPNAQDQFMAIQHAYDVLKSKRDRYDAGLALEASLRNTDTQPTSGGRFEGYRTPLRCGLIMCEGTEVLGKFNVSKIFAWEDVRDSNGRTLIVSWEKDAKTFTEVWA